MLIGISTAITAQLRGGVAFTPATLFANGEQGVWFAPSPDTCFTDTTGTTPAGVGDAVALMLDKSQGAGYKDGEFTGLGPELVTNGTFDTGTSGWGEGSSTTISQSDGLLKVTSDGGTNSLSYQGFSTVVGQTYYVSGLHSTAGGGQNGRLWIKPTFNNTASDAILDINVSNEDFKALFVAQHTTTYVVLSTVGAVAGQFCLWDNVSVRELPGNHAAQGTAAARPLLQQTTGGLWYLDFDGVDDDLKVTKNITVSKNWYAAAAVNMLTRNGINIGFFATGGRGYQTTSTDAMGLFQRTDSVQDLRAALRIGSGTSFSVSRRNDYSIGTPFVGEGYHEANTINAQVDGGTIDTTSADDDATSSKQFAISSVNEMEFYGGVFIKKAVSSDNKEKTRAFLADKSGVTL